MGMRSKWDIGIPFIIYIALTILICTSGVNGIFSQGQIFYLATLAGLCFSFSWMTLDPGYSHTGIATTERIFFCLRFCCLY